jgi:hypothetical protein
MEAERQGSAAIRRSARASRTSQALPIAVSHRSADKVPRSTADCQLSPIIAASIGNHAKVESTANELAATMRKFDEAAIVWPRRFGAMQAIKPLTP